MDPRILRALAALTAVVLLACIGFALMVAIGNITLTRQLPQNTVQLKATVSHPETERRLPQMRRHLYLADVSAAATAWRENNIPLMGSLLQRHLPSAGEADMRQFEWFVLWGLFERSRPLRRIELSEHLKGVAFSPTGSDLAVVFGSDHSVGLVDAATGVLRERFEPCGRYKWRNEFIAFSPDGKTLAYQADPASIVRLRNLTNGKLSDLSSSSGGEIFCAEFSPSGDTLATGSENGTVLLWDLATNKSRIIQKLGAAVATLDYSPDGNLLAVGCRETSAQGSPATDGFAHKTVKVFEVASGNVRYEFQHDTAVQDVAFSSDGKSLATGGSGKGAALTVFNLIEGKRVVVCQAGITEAVGDSASGISCVAFSPDGKWLVSAGFGIQVWSTSNFQRYAVLGGHTSLVQEISFSPENLMASACVDHTIQIWDLSDKKQINTTVRRFGDRIYDVKICPNGEIAVHDIQSPNLAMWDPVADRVRYIEEVGRGIAFSPEGILASVSGGKIRLIDLMTGEQAESPLARTVYEMAYSSKNDLLALGTLAGEFELWKARNGNRILQVSTGLGRTDPIAFSSDGKQVATGHLETGRVFLWDAEQGEKLRELDVGFGCGELSLDFSQDGRLLAVGRAFLGIQIWDLTSEESNPDELPVATTAVKFAPSGKSLFSGAKGDAMLHVWDLETHRQCALPGVERIRDIDVSADGNTVVVGGWGGAVRLLRAIDDNSLLRH